MKAIVTGHSRGLGAAIADELLRRGIPVLGLARQQNSELGQRHAKTLRQTELDLSDSAALTAWLEGGALRDFIAGARTVLLVNNAGVVQPVGPLSLQNPAEIARAVALNVAGPLMLSAALAACTPESVERRILHVSSGAGRSAYPGWSVYCATKAALDHHARAAVLDRVPKLRICSLAPGVIDTGMQAEIRSSSVDRFPMRARFDALKRDGALTAPDACARQLVDVLLADGFGQVPVADLREI